MGLLWMELLAETVFYHELTRMTSDMMKLNEVEGVAVMVVVEVEVEVEVPMMVQELKVKKLNLVEVEHNLLKQAMLMVVGLGVWVSMMFDKLLVAVQASWCD